MSQQNMEKNMADGPTADGLINYLVYLVGALVAIILGTIQKHFGGRINKIEEVCGDNSDAIHSLQIDVVETMHKNDTSWHEKFEGRRIENKKDFADLHKKVESGHSEILKELRKK